MKYLKTRSDGALADRRISACRVVGSYTLWLKFEDGLEGKVYLGGLVEVGMFRAWKDPELFEQVAIDEDAKALSWDGGIHLDSDVLYQGVVNRARLTVH